MNIDHLVLRKIPQECIKGIKSGTLIPRGGAIYDQAGGIVKHLQFAGDSGLQSAAGSLGSIDAVMSQVQLLGMASVALSGLNLAVSIAGFAIVCHKLDQISAKLEQIDGKLNQLLAGQARIEWRQELERHALTMAAVENLARGLRTGRQSLLDDAIPRLTESSFVYRRVSVALLNEMPSVYKDPMPFEQALQQAVGCDLAQAQAMAHLGHLQESLDIVNASRKWQRAQLDRIEGPLQHGPAWLALLSDGEVHAAKRLVQDQRSIPVAMEYAEQQIRVCQRLNISLNDLAKLTDDAPYVVVSLDKTTKPLATTRTGQRKRAGESTKSRRLKK